MFSRDDGEKAGKHTLAGHDWQVEFIDAAAGQPWFDGNGWYATNGIEHLGGYSTSTAAFEAAQHYEGLIDR